MHTAFDLATDRSTEKLNVATGVMFIWDLLRLTAPVMLIYIYIYIYIYYIYIYMQNLQLRAACMFYKLNRLGLGNISML